MFFDCKRIINCNFFKLLVFEEININNIKNQKYQLTLYLLQDLLDRISLNNKIYTLNAFNLFFSNIDFNDYIVTINRLICEKITLAKNAIIAKIV